MRWLRIQFGLLPVVVLLAALPGRADQDEETVSSPVHAVLAAAEARDDDALRALVEDEDLVPWVIAHELCVVGETEAALRFAKAAKRKELRPLADYVRLLVRRRPSAEMWRHRGRILDFRMRKDWFDLLRYLERERLDLTGQDVPTVIILSAKATALSALDRFTEAMETFGRAATLAESFGWWSAAVKMLDGAFYVSLRLGDHQSTLDWKKRELTVHSRTGNEEKIAFALANLGTVYGNNADYKQAIEHYLPALEEYGDALSRSARAHIGLNLGLAYRSLGHLADAQAWIAEAVALSHEAGHSYMEALAHLSLGGLAVEIGDYGVGAAHLEWAREHLPDSAGPGDLADIAGSLGILAWRLDDLDTAEDHFENAQELYAQAESQRGVLRAREALASVARKRGRLGEAVRELRVVAREQERIEDWGGLSESLHQLSLAYRAQDDVQRAHATRQRQLDIAQRTGSATEEVRGRSELARLYVHRGAFGEALEEAHEAAAVLGLIFDRLGPGQGALARAKTAPVYEVGLAAAVGAESVDDACFFLEGGRAGALLVALEGRSSLRQTQVEASLREEERHLRAEEARARLELLVESDLGDRRAIRRARAELEQAHAALQTTVERIQTERGLAADLLYPDALSPAVVQASLAPDEALVTYGTCSEGRLTALVLTKSEGRLVPLGPSGDVEALCETLLAGMERDAPIPDASALRDRAVTPLDLPETVRRVIVSPVARLSYVPPALLFPGREVASAPSASTYVRLSGVKRLDTADVLAFGDPAYELRPMPRRDATAALARGGRLQPLPGTGIEARTVGTTVLLGEEATETRLRALLEGDRKWRAVHLACHGLVDPERPSYSALALTPSEEDDGLLKVLDVFQMRVPAELVVLSACDTGRGRIVPAEGILGLAGAFMVAGAPRVLVSLWRVDDEATRALMIRFYELWNPKAGPEEGLGAAAALEAAQAHVREQERWRHPYFWAGWTLWGAAD